MESLHEHLGVLLFIDLYENMSDCRHWMISHVKKTYQELTSDSDKDGTTARISRLSIDSADTVSDLLERKTLYRRERENKHA